MSAVTFTTTTGQHEAGNAAGVIKYAADMFNSAGVRFPHSKMVRIIRRARREGGAGRARELVDGFIRATGQKLYARSWIGFEMYTATGYADPTGARAAQNVDRERGSL